MEHRKNYRKSSGCRYYNAFYTRGACAFYREKSGYCEQKEKAVEAKECCDKYKHRKHQDKNVAMEDLEKVKVALEELKLVFGDYDV